MWVEAARQWAARGLPVAPADLAGAGDATTSTPSDVHGLYRPDMVDEAMIGFNWFKEDQDVDRVVAVAVPGGSDVRTLRPIWVRRELHAMHDAGSHAGDGAGR